MEASSVLINKWKTRYYLQMFVNIIFIETFICIMDNFLLNSVYLNYILLLLYFLCTNTEAIQGRFFLSHPLC